MPKINVATPFNYGPRPLVKHYKKGEQEVTQAVADHAQTQGFLVKTKSDGAITPKPEAPADKA